MAFQPHAQLSGTVPMTMLPYGLHKSFRHVSTVFLNYDAWRASHTRCLQQFRTLTTGRDCFAMVVGLSNEVPCLIVAEQHRGALLAPRNVYSVIKDGFCSRKTLVYLNAPF